MKRSVFRIITVMLVMVICVACDKTSVDKVSNKEVDPLDTKIDTSMPYPDGHNKNAGGDMLINFIQPCKMELDGVTGNIQDLAEVELVKVWIDEHKFVMEKEYSDLEDYANTYSFIHDFNISKEDFVKVYNSQVFESLNTPDEAYLNEEEIDLLFSGDKETIVSYFASDYSIVVGEKVFSPRWVYYHTPEDYVTVGITKDQIREKIQYYETLPLSIEARKCFTDKLGEYLGEEVVFGDEELLKWHGGLYHDFSLFTVTVGNETYDAKWLSTHTIQDMEEAGITVDMLGEMLENMSVTCSDTKEYNMINSCYLRMKELQ